MNDTDYLTIMSELKFIGSVGEGQFLNSTTGKIENKNVITCLIRSFSYPTETGQTSAKFCMHVISKALRLLDKYSKLEGADEYVKMIKNYILNAKKSIGHLKETHADNHLAYATFDSIIVTISQCIKE